MTQVPETVVETSPEGQVSRQYVTFQLDEEAFAFPMARVREIIRVPQTVQVPLTPGSLVGLANLRGRVLAVLDLRSVLGLAQRDWCEATRVIVVDSGVPLGVVVDKVARVLDIEDAAIEGTDQVRSTISAELLDGVAKNVDGHDLVQLLDVEKAIRRDFAGVMEAMQGAVADLDAPLVASVTEEGAGDTREDVRQLVSFVVDGQEYAFDIAEVEEIVRVPAQVSLVPRTEDHVLGLINLRGQLLPLVSLRRMFRMHEEALDEHNRVLVVGLRHEDGTSESVGIVVDQVREVLRIPHQRLDRMPGLLRQSRAVDEIGSICRLEDGRRLVSVLTSGALFQHPAIREAVAARNAEMVEQGMAQQATQVRRTQAGELDDDETQLVVFQLAGQEFSVPIECVKEITRVPAEMTSVPRTPPFIEGIVNLRGSVLPVLDMRTRFGLPRMERNERQRILVLELAGLRTGFVTDAVLEVLRLSRSLIEQAPALSQEQSRVMGRVVNFRDQGRMIQILDADELLDETEVDALNEAL